MAMRWRCSPRWSWLVASAVLFGVRSVAGSRSRSAVSAAEGSAHRPEMFAHSLYRRDVGDSAVTAASFESGQYVEMAEDLLDRSDEWSISAWVYVEGGQEPGAILFGYYDECKSQHIWKLHLSGTGNLLSGRDCWLTVTLLGDTLLDHQEHCKFGEWFNVNLVRSNHEMLLYHNRILVDRELVHDEPVEVLASVSRCHKRRLILGDRNARGFRGMVANVTISSSKSGNVTRQATKANANLVLAGTPEPSERLWRSSSPPFFFVLPRSTEPTKLRSKIPRCGRTMCDDPLIAKSYAVSQQLLHNKRVRCHVVNFRESDGSNPSLTPVQVRIQAKQLRDAFSKWNIDWEITVVNVNDSSLRKTLVMMDCQQDFIGDGMCQDFCDYAVTGKDGGDCSSSSRCSRRHIANGVCDSSCNTAEYHYDGGDCCSGDFPSYCYDPSSSKRGYITIEELRRRLGEDNMQQLVILPVRFMESSTVGVASFPWDKRLGGPQGDVIVAVDHFGSPMSDTVIHEIGHTLGLWHVHRGVSEMTCHDECLETTASFELGDLVEDTPPAKLQTSCEADADKTGDTETCGIPEAATTSLHQNYMSYANGSCNNDKTFTAQQAARMHCYLDLIYGGWTDSVTSAVPTIPKVTTASVSSVSLSWLPPLKRVYSASLNSVDCMQCSPDEAVLSQYVAEAYFISVKKGQKEEQVTSSAATPRVTGPPDSVVCQRSQSAWNPFDHENAKSCAEGECVLTLEFSNAVLPERLVVWVVWFEKMGRETANSISKIEYLTEANEVIKRATRIPVSCDIPYTAYLGDLELPVKKIKLHLSAPDTSIDAAHLLSRNGHGGCRLCPPINYIVHRVPAFPAGPTVALSESSFTDSGLVIGNWYEYAVTPVISGRQGRRSATLRYRHSPAFCGDGVLSENESCDDGNALGGDGCDSDCAVEQRYSCKGVPSNCRLVGDGFHISASSSPGFKDVWSSSASLLGGQTDAQHTRLFSAGPPHTRTSCTPEPYFGVAYTPFDIGFKVDFENPVVAAAIVLFLGSDGITLEDKSSKELYFVLKDSAGDVRATLSSRAICRLNPIVIGVKQDLSKPFYKTKSVELLLPTASISVAALGLRTLTWLDPVEQQAKCSGPGSLFNVGTGKCVSYDRCDDRPFCPSLQKVANGQAKCTGNSEGHRCSITCQKGFTRYPTPDDVVCINGNWVNANVDCVPVNCGRLDIKWATVTCPNGTLYGSFCHVQCVAAASVPPSRDLRDLDGVDWRSSAFCQHSGRWTSPAGHCLPPTCATESLLLDPASARVLTLACRQSSEIEAGDKCSISCNSGYHVRGHSVRERSTKLYCSADGRWMGDPCKRVTCPDIEGFSYQCTEAFNSGSICSVTCAGTYKLSPSTIACLSSGRWNATMDSLCSSPIPAGGCRQLKNTEKIHFDCTGSAFGSLCRVSCINKLEQVHKLYREYVVGTDDYKKARKYLLVGPENLSRASKSLSPLESFSNKLVCTGTGEWFPPPEDLQCQ